MDNLTLTQMASDLFTFQEKSLIKQAEASWHETFKHLANINSVCKQCFKVVSKRHLTSLLF